MLELKILIIKLGSVNRLSTRSIASCKIPSLDHELLDDSVETRSLVRERDARFANALLAGAESAEVFCCFGHDVVVQLEADPSFGFLAN